MPASFAGIGIGPLHTHQEEVERYYHRLRIEEREDPAYFLGGIDHLPSVHLPMREPPRLGVLRWPTGADQWATFHFVASDVQLAQLRTAIGSTPTAQPLVITDGTTTITTDMYLLPPRPIAQRGSNEWYLITLADMRFYWWQNGNASAPTNPATWNALFTSLFAMAGVSSGLTIDPIDAAYLTPNAQRWNVGVEPIPILLEAAAQQVGVRIVRNLDGTVRVSSYATAAAADTARWGRIKALVEAGGQITGPDIGRYVPASVDCGFFDAPTINTTLASLALGPYAGTNGVAVGIGLYTADPVGSTPAQQVALANRAVTDYYDWALAYTDCDLRGVVNENTCGLDEVMEWVHHPEMILTRIIRPQWSDRNVYGNVAGDTPATGTAPEYRDDCLNGYLVRNKAILSLDQNTGLLQTTYVFDYSYGIKCAPEVSGSGSGSGPGFGGSGGIQPDPNFSPILDFPIVSNVCPDPCAETTSYVTIRPTSIGNDLCYLKCDGSSVSRATYAALFAVIGTTFGGSGGNFTLPTLADPVSGLSYFIRTQPSLVNVEKELVTIQAPGAVSNPVCFTSSTCCSGSGPTDCCAGQPAANSVALAFDGPLTSNCGQGTLAGTMTRTGNVGLIWSLPSPIGGQFNDSVTATLYCVGAEWRLSGVFNIYGASQPIFYDIQLVIEPLTGLFLGGITIPGCGQVAVAVVPPCGTGSGSGSGSGGDSIDVLCCPGVSLPTTIHAALAGGTGSCTCLNGLTITMTWNGTLWQGSVAGCSGTVTFSMTPYCSYGFTGNCSSTNQTTGPASCHPFKIVDTIAVSGCCAGNIGVTITP